MKVAIRVDGSSFIGMGHVVRSLALGSAFRRAGHEVVFFSRFEHGISRLREQGFVVQAFTAGLPDGPGCTARVWARRSGNKNSFERGFTIGSNVFRKII